MPIRSEQLQMRRNGTVLRGMCCDELRACSSKHFLPCVESQQTERWLSGGMLEFSEKRQLSQPVQESGLAASPNVSTEHETV